MRSLVYGSVCSGIEAATVAWHPLGMRPAFFAEVAKFPSQVLAHHYPDVPNAGDFTAIQGDEYGAIDILVGGTPCQDFSVAGLRAGLAGKRGQLTVEFGRLAHRVVSAARTRWFVWENVPGVLSIDRGRAFAEHLGILAGRPVRVPAGGWKNSGIIVEGEVGWGLAYRVLNAQHFGIPQRRHRVFVVGYFGDWRRAAAVLFERHSLSGYPAPRRKAGQGTTYDVAPSLASSGPGVERAGDSRGQDPGVAVCMATGQGSAEIGIGIGTTLNCNHEAPIVTHALRGEGFDASEDGTGRGTPPLVPVAFDTTQITSAANYSNPKPGDPCHPLASGAHSPAIAFTSKDHGADAGEISPTLRSMGHDGSHANGGGQVAVMTLAIRGREGESSLEVREDGIANAILTPNGGRAGIGVGAIAIQNATRGKDQNGLGISDDGSMYTLDQGSQHGVAIGWSEELTASVEMAGTVQRGGDGERHEGVMTPTMAVRRLTPRECERLQGFPDDYTKISNKTADGPHGIRLWATAWLCLSCDGSANGLLRWRC